MWSLVSEATSHCFASSHTWMIQVFLFDKLISTINLHPRSPSLCAPYRLFCSDINYNEESVMALIASALWQAYSASVGWRRVHITLLGDLSLVSATALWPLSHLLPHLLPQPVCHADSGKCVHSSFVCGYVPKSTPYLWALHLTRKLSFWLPTPYILWNGSVNFIYSQ